LLLFDLTADYDPSPIKPPKHLGHPHYNYIGDRIVQILQKQKQHQNQSMLNVVIVGHGNVALDCARILAKGGTTTSSMPSSSSSSSSNTVTNSLYHTDISLPAYNILQQYPFSNITIVGRRGHVQASFTIKELRELFNLQNDGYDTSFIVQKEELDMCTSTIATQNELNGPNGRPKQRIDKLLREAAANGMKKLIKEIKN
jgi:adrenodoxin-NADP+ reductase